MAGRSNGGTSDLTVRILQQIRDEIRKTNERLDQTNERLDQTNERLDRGFAELRGRLDNVLEFAGERYREQGRAIQALDRRLSRLEHGPRGSR